MKTFIFGTVLMLSSIICLGHNPLSARYHLESGENASMLSISLSQDGVNHALLNRYTSEELDKLSRKEFEELIVQYIKDNFDLIVDSEKIELKEGGIKLGSHQTDLKFVLPPISQEIDEFGISISAFKENNNHQTIFTHNFNVGNGRIILSSRNDYQSNVGLSQSSYLSHWFILIFLIIIIPTILITARLYGAKIINNFVQFS
jgi:hypothetical protein